MNVDAAQHVSGVLTSKQSARGRAGYQTLFYTRELLTPDQISIIESQVQNNSTREGNSKWQFYGLTDERYVISRIIPIPEPDEFGRQGRFLTHSLIFNVPVGYQLDDALFELLNSQRFFSSLDAALASESLQSGHIQHLSLVLKRQWINETESLMREWSGEQLNQLFMLMSDPRQVTEQGHHVTLVGSEAQILSVLKVAFLLTPPAARKFCTFDTDVSGSDGPSGITFWGHGMPSPVGAANYWIDAAKRQVIIPELSPLRAAGFSPEQFSMPLRKAIAAQFSRPSEHMLRSLLHHQYEAFTSEPIYRALLHEPDLPLTTTDLELLSAFGKKHLGLELVLALKSGNESQRLQALAAPDDSRSYKELVREFRAWPDFKPWQVFSPVFMSTWFEIFRGEYTLDHLITAVTKVSEHGTAQDRKYVLDIHTHLDLTERQELRQRLKASPHRFDKLLAALDKSIKASNSAAGKPHSLLRRILHLSKK